MLDLQVMLDPCVNIFACPDGGIRGNAAKPLINHWPLDFKTAKPAAKAMWQKKRGPSRKSGWAPVNRETRL